MAQMMVLVALKIKEILSEGHWTTQYAFYFIDISQSDAFLRLFRGVQACRSSFGTIDSAL